MNRRLFLKSIGAAGCAAFMPSYLNLTTAYRRANAAVNYAGANVIAPPIMPQVINIFLYGGPSELSGNLSNITDIEAGSQNSYASNSTFGAGILLPQTDVSGTGLRTADNFWGSPGGNGGAGGAGGDDMQFMLDQNFMSVYRTLMKRRDPNRSHRESLLMSQKGSLDIETGAGVGTRIAAMLLEHRLAYQSSTLLADGSAIPDIEKLVLPFISFEGETRWFAPDPDVSIPVLFKGLSLDNNLQNPFSRTISTNPNNDALEDLVGKIVTGAYRRRFSRVNDGFILRADLDEKVGNIQGSVSQPLPTITIQEDADAVGVAINTPLVYPQNQYTDNIRAAVTLAIENPSSLYMTIGGGLGGWDDHNNAVSDYRTRMNQLFSVLKAAMMHIKYSDSSFGSTPGGLTRTTDNIVINMYGDFGRIVNLNNSLGWDHGNNQNFFTFGGADVRPNGALALGKVVGTTKIVGDPGVNNQVTEPTNTSYEFDVMSIASTVYSYFGAQNPEVMTADAVLNPGGDPVIDETV